LIENPKGNQLVAAEEQVKELKARLKSKDNDLLNLRRLKTSLPIASETPPSDDKDDD
jgi:hypothetical protein